MLTKTVLILFILLFLALPTLGLESVKAAIKIDQPVQLATIEAKPLDIRTVILRDYLAKHKSPLINHAGDFVEAADTYNMDWRLVAAISGVESTFGKRTPGNAQYPSYNGWGWGVYGTKSLGFKSWRDGIFTVSEGLKKNYINKGLTTPKAMNRIYAASPSWGWKVEFFINDIEKFAQNYPEYSQAGIIKPSLKVNIAGTSATLAKAY